MDVLNAIKDRHSTRAFLNKPVSRETVHKILEIARFAPSGVNTQPWQVSVVTGKVQAAICSDFVETYEAGEKGQPDYQYYPDEWYEPLKSRRFACGMALYNQLGIKREDTQRRKENWIQNYKMFGAPVGLFFWIDQRLAVGSWLDCGMFLQNVMLAARGFGLATCPQAAMAEYPDIVRKHLNVDSSQLLICGMALGYADPNAAINNYRTEREAVSGFSTWHGFA